MGSLARESKMNMQEIMFLFGRLSELKEVAKECASALEACDDEVIIALSQYQKDGPAPHINTVINALMKAKNFMHEVKDAL
jgi:hypothetical protein